MMTPRALGGRADNEKIPILREFCTWMRPWIYKYIYREKEREDTEHPVSVMLFLWKTSLAHVHIANYLR